MIYFKVISKNNPLNRQKGLDKPSQMCQCIGMATQKTEITFSAEDLRSIPAAAKELGVDFSTVYRWIKKGAVHTFRIGSQVYITVDEIERLKRERGKA